MAKRVLVDMDGTLFRFHDEVDYLERMYEKDFFRNLKPFQNMIDGIKLFMKENPEVEVFICSSAIESEYCVSEKNAAIDEYLPEIDKTHRIFPPMGKNKADYIPGGVDKDTYLIDDYNIGLNKFLYDGGSVIKAHNNINMKGMGAFGGDKDIRWTGDIIHVEDTPELIAAELKQMIGLEINLDNLYLANDIQKKDEFKEVSGPGKFVIEMNQKQGFFGFHETGVEAHLMNDTYSGQMMYFKNPFNAIRWLNGDQKSEEFHISEDLSLSRMQLESILHNMYAQTRSRSLRELINSPVIVLNDEVKGEIEKAYNNSLKPILAIAQVPGEGVRVYHDETVLLKDKQKFEASEELGGAHISFDYLITPDKTKGKGIDALIGNAEKKKSSTVFDSIRPKKITLDKEGL